MKRVEFFNKNDGDVMALEDDHAEVLTQKSELTEEIYDKIVEDYPAAAKALQQLYQKSERNLPYFKFLVVRRFVKCNFGNYDIHTFDIDADGQWNFETVDCPCRGDCPLENIVCRPKLDTGLSLRELQVVALCALGDKSSVIADKLSLSINTVNQHIKHILKKLNKENIKSVITWYHENKKNFTPAEIS